MFIPKPSADDVRITTRMPSDVYNEILNDIDMNFERISLNRYIVTCIKERLQRVERGEYD